MNRVLASLIILIIAFSASTCTKNITNLSTIAEQSNGLFAGYLSFKDLPNSLVLLPPPPINGSTAEQLDWEVNELMINTKDTLILNRAKADANLDFPEAIQSFSDILPITISEINTPYLYVLMRRILTDAALSTYLAKKHYARQRPFMVNGISSCTPDRDDHMKQDGSYPSGHAAIGWTWALVLSELFPQETNRLLFRGKEFGDSRVICNVHWSSDVEAGRFMGASLVARLHGNANFIADLSKAKKEISRLIAK